jgi:hypothetical protein
VTGDLSAVYYLIGAIIGGALVLAGMWASGRK